MKNKKVRCLFIITTFIALGLLIASAFVQAAYYQVQTVRDSHYNDKSSYSPGNNNLYANTDDAVQDSGSEHDVYPNTDGRVIDFDHPGFKRLLHVGDYDGNRKINTDDLLQFVDHWGTHDPLYDEDGSGVVDEKDLALVFANWGRGKMLRGDLVHSGEGEHCKITDSEVELIRKFANPAAVEPFDTTLSRLADLNSDGVVSETDVALAEAQRDMHRPSRRNYDREDINCDGDVEKDDIETLRAFWGPMDYDFSWADVNSDSAVNTADLLQVLGAY